MKTCPGLRSDKNFIVKSFKMTALRLRLQKEIFDVTEEQLVSDVFMFISKSRLGLHEKVFFSTMDLHESKWMQAARGLPGLAQGCCANFRALQEQASEDQ